jgi:hypothetical protein
VSVLFTIVEKLLRGVWIPITQTRAVSSKEMFTAIRALWAFIRIFRQRQLNRARVDGPYV